VGEVLVVGTAAGMTIGGGFVFITASLPGNRGAAILAVTLYLLVLGAIGLGASLTTETTATPYW
jgi:hypothetical protein